MIAIEKLILLRSVAFFKKISDELLIEIAYYLQEERVAAQHCIIRKGEISDTLYIIVAGRVAIIDEGKILTELGSRQIFGELAFLSPEPRTATVMALEECLLLKLHRHHLFDHFGMDVDLCAGIIDELCQKMRSMAKQIQERAKNAEQTLPEA